MLVYGAQKGRLGEIIDDGPWGGGHSVLEGLNTTRVLRIIFLLDLAVGKHGLTFANTSKPQYPSHPDVVLCSLWPPRRWADAGVAIKMLRGNPLLSANYYIG